MAEETEMVNQCWISDSGPVPMNSIKTVMQSICNIGFAKKTAKGTGFLVKILANHTTMLKGLLTNNHVITDKDIKFKETCILRLDSVGNTPLKVQVPLKDCDYSFMSDVAFMDASFIALPGFAIDQLDDAGVVWLSIHPEDAKVGEKVFIIQHPAAQSKGKQCLAQGEVKNTESKSGKASTYIFVKHSADTEPGSSGSPVMTFDGRLIGLHRCSVNKEINGATNARCILKAIIEEFAEFAEYNPDIAQTISEASSKSIIRVASSSGHGRNAMDFEETDSPANPSNKQATPTTKNQGNPKIEDFDEGTLKKKTRKCKTDFAEFEPKGVIIDKLAGKGILTNQKSRELNNMPNKDDRKNELWHHLFECRHSKAITTFLTALRDSEEVPYQDILKKILKTSPD